MKAFLMTCLLALSVLSQEVQFSSVEEYFTYLVNHPNIDSRTLYQNLNKIDDSVVEFEKALRNYDVEKVQQLLQHEKVTVETSVFFEDKKSPYHILGMHSMNQSSENISNRIKQYGLAAYAQYMTSPLVLLSSLTAKNIDQQEAQVAVVKILLEHAQDSNALLDKSDWFGRLPIILAAENRNIPLLEVLLFNGANPNLNVSKTTPAMDDLFYNMDADGALHKCLYGKLGLGKAYIPKDRETETAKVCMQTLLDHDVNVNQKNIYYETPLLAAVCAGEDELVQLLLEHGADTDILAMPPGLDGANWGNATGAPRRMVPKRTQESTVFSTEDYRQYGQHTFKIQYKEQHEKQGVPFCLIRKPDSVKEHYKSYKVIKRLLRQVN
ncbi:MAG TPA: hypothetical protein PKC21_06045 [Oligoflexia bacterium]|nr:hypothetical protein [Oligoflexia bacterium]HMR24896.1 hypothetical protein [Oligoflexia bacterium]